MKTVALSTVAEINPAGPRGDALDPGTNLDFVPMAAVGEDGRMEVVEQRPYSELMKGYTAFRPSDVLVAKITPCFENNKIALATVATDYAFGSTEFHVVRCSPGQLHPPYLTHFLRQDRIRQAGERRMTGSAGQRRVPKDFLEKIDVPLPPLAEQERIAAILDQADSLRRLRQCAIDRLNSLGQAIFYQMFGDPAANPKRLPTKPLGSVIKVSSGEGLTAENQKGGDYPVYGGNGINGWHDTYRVPAGTVVIGRVGVYCGAIHVTQNSAWVTDNALVVSKKDEVMNTAYLARALESANLNQYAGRSAQPLVSSSRIYPVEILVPPIDAQNEFERNVAEQAASLKYFAAHRSALDALFSSLQHRAFRGEL